MPTRYPASTTTANDSQMISCCAVAPQQPRWSTVPVPHGVTLAAAPADPNLKQQTSGMMLSTP
eukprot:2460855-Rhodomonas_salina.2